MGGGYFCDVHRRKAGSHTDGDASPKACDEEIRETVKGTRAVSSHDKYKCREQQKRLASQAVGQCTCRECPDEASRQCDAHSESLHGRVSHDAEKLFIEYFRAPDNDPVVTDH